MKFGYKTPKISGARRDDGLESEKKESCRTNVSCDLPCLPDLPTFVIVVGSDHDRHLTPVQVSLVSYTQIIRTLGLDHLTYK